MYAQEVTHLRKQDIQRYRHVSVEELKHFDTFVTMRQALVAEMSEWRRLGWGGKRCIDFAILRTFWECHAQPSPKDVVTTTVHQQNLYREALLPVSSFQLAPLHENILGSRMWNPVSCGFFEFTSGININVGIIAGINMNHSFP